jgi:hypothetical protein
MNRDRVEILFRYGHLSQPLQTVSLLFYHVAITLVDSLPETAERTLMLRKLWEAQKLAVFAKSEELEPKRTGGQ